MPIGETDLLAIRNTKAPVHSARHAPWSGGRLVRPAMPDGSSVGRISAVQPARPRIQRLIVAFIRRSRRQRYVFPRTNARINESPVEQTLPGLEVESPPLALRVRAVRAASPAPRSTQSRASANPRTLPTRIRRGNVANPGLRCEKSAVHDFASHTPRQSKTCAHGLDAGGRLAKGRCDRGMNWNQNQRALMVTTRCSRQEGNSAACTTVEVRRFSAA